MNVALEHHKKKAEGTIILSQSGDDVNPLLTTPPIRQALSKNNPPRLQPILNKFHRN